MASKEKRVFRPGVKYLRKQGTDEYFIWTEPLAAMSCMIPHNPNDEVVDWDRIGKIVVGIQTLKSDHFNDTSYWTRSGLPNIKKLEAITGEKDISVAERAHAWEEFGGFAVMDPELEAEG